jgi:hypothetical protein
MPAEISAWLDREFDHRYLRHGGAVPKSVGVVSFQLDANGLGQTARRKGLPEDPIRTSSPGLAGEQSRPEQGAASQCSKF